MKKTRKKRKKAKQGPAVHTLASTAVPTQSSDGDQLRSVVLLWIAGLGSVLTLLGGLQAFIELADWVHFIVSNWSLLTESFWRFVARLLGLQFIPELSAPMTFFISLTGVAFGSMALEFAHTKGERPPFFSVDRMVRIGCSLFVANLSLFIFEVAIEHFAFKTSLQEVFLNLESRKWALLICSCGGLLFFCMAQPSRQIMDYLILGAFIGVFYFVIALPSSLSASKSGTAAIERYRALVFQLGLGFFPLQMMSLISWAAPRYFNYRFCLVGLGVLTLLALNYVSQLEISGKPPRI